MVSLSKVTGYFNENKKKINYSTNMSERSMHYIFDFQIKANKSCSITH